MNFRRGFLYAFLFACVGFSIPALIIGLAAAYHFTFNEIHPMDRAEDLKRLPAIVLIPSVGMGLMFGLSAFCTFATARRIRFARAFIFIASAMILSMFLYSPPLNMKGTDPTAWKLTVYPIVAALMTTMVVLAIDANRDSSSVADHAEPNREGVDDFDRDRAS